MFARKDADPHESTMSSFGGISSLKKGVVIGSKPNVSEKELLIVDSEAGLLIYTIDEDYLDFKLDRSIPWSSIVKNPFAEDALKVVYFFGDSVVLVD